MTKQALENIVRLYLRSDYDLQHVMTAVDAYCSACNDGKPIVSRSKCDYHGQLTFEGENMVTYCSNCGDPV